MLEAPDTGPTTPACQLIFSCQSPYHISKICILCEARVLEVYGHHGEYIKTFKNELIEEAEDMIVFRSDVVLERPLALCSIKFAGLRNTNEMWLYGVKVIRTKFENDPENVVTIPLDTVEQRLSQMGLALSNKAEAFKQIVEQCQKSLTMGQPDIGYFIATLQHCNLIKKKSPSPQNLSESMESLTKSQRDPENNLSKSNTPVYKESNQYSSMSPYFVANAGTSPMPCQRSSVGAQTDEEFLSLEENLKAHIDNKITELHKNLWDTIHRRFEEIETKLFCKLEEIESFVKPQGVVSS